MNLNEASERARALRARFETLERKRHGRAWTTAEIALGFVGDVGDLAKLVQGAEGVRDIPDLQARIEHELSDCLWSVLVLADRLGVDIERAFDATLRDLDAYVDRELAGDAR